MTNIIQPATRTVITNAAWIDRLSTTSDSASLEAGPRQELGMFLALHVFVAGVPEPVQAVFSGQLLDDAVWDTKHHGVLAATNKLQFILGLMLVTAGGIELERDGLIGLTARAALEFALGNLIPEAHPARLSAQRSRLRFALEGGQDRVSAQA
jgi:hypothetical protein